MITAAYNAITSPKSIRFPEEISSIVSSKDMKKELFSLDSDQAVANDLPRDVLSELPKDPEHAKIYLTVMIDYERGNLLHTQSKVEHSQRLISEFPSQIAALQEKLSAAENDEDRQSIFQEMNAYQITLDRYASENEIFIQSWPEIKTASEAKLAKLQSMLEELSQEQI